MKKTIALLALAVGMSGCAPLAGVVLQAAVGDDIKAALKPHVDKLKAGPEAGNKETVPPEKPAVEEPKPSPQPPVKDNPAPKKGKKS